MTAQTTSVAREIPRRTILKTAAWSVPVVAATAATPFAAASTNTDLTLTAQPVGEGITGTSPDGQSQYFLGWTSRYSVSTLGTTATPGGAVIALSFDARLFASSLASIDGVALTPADTTTVGNITTTTFTVPVPIPTSPGSVTLTIGFDGGGAPTPPWHTDVNPISVSVLPPAGSSDPNPSNSTYSFSAVYS